MTKLPNKALHLTTFPLTPASPTPSRQVNFGVSGKEPMKGICALCNNSRTLEKSHIIPNASFKKIKQSLNGKSIILNDDKYTWIQYSQESWWEYLLCGKCEDKISTYEKYFFESIRGRNGIKKNEHSRGITYTGIDYHKFRLFLVSLLWRAAVAKNSFFSKVILVDKWLEELRNSLNNEKPPGKSKFGCRLYKLYDSTINGFDIKSLEQLVIAPISRIEKRVDCFMFIIEGIVIEYYCPAILYSDFKKPGVFQNNNVYFIPFQEICEIPEIMNLMVVNCRKDQNNMVKFKNR